MPDNFVDFPYGEAHKETPAAVKAATDALIANKKIILQQFDRLTCPTNTDPAIARAEAHTLLLDSAFGSQIYLNSLCGKKVLFCRRPLLVLFSPRLSRQIM